MADMYQEAITLAHETFTEAEQWGQLAEELNEAAQAALKMQRLYMPRNKPRKSADACYVNIVEELADIQNCLAMLASYGFKPTPAELKFFRDMKMRRMVDIIKTVNALSGLPDVGLAEDAKDNGTHDCRTCKYKDTNATRFPCSSCLPIMDHPLWEAR